MLCVICQTEFERAPQSERVTCSRSCRVALAWKRDPDKRIASIRATKRTPEHRARMVEVNHQRWARPGEREKLSELNRQRWADPDIKIAWGRSISAAWDDNRRAAYSAFRAQQWAEDPAFRAAVTAGVRRSHGSPEYRALFSRLLRDRWQDPAWRERWSAGIKRHMNKPETRAKLSAVAKARWAKWRTARFGVDPGPPPRRFSPPSSKPTLQPQRDWSPPRIVRSPIVVSPPANQTALQTMAAVLADGPTCIRCGKPVSFQGRTNAAPKYCRPCFLKYGAREMHKVIAHSLQIERQAAAAALDPDAFTPATRDEIRNWMRRQKVQASTLSAVNDVRRQEGLPPFRITR